MLFIFFTLLFTIHICRCTVDQAVMLKTPPPLPYFHYDKGVQLVKENRFYGFGAAFPSPFDNAQQDLVVQYELKLEELGCGGAYIKMPRAEDNFNMAELNNESPYALMFGPDKCGASSKVHFIIQKQSPVTGKWEEKHLSSPPSFPSDNKSHLYTLLLKQDASFRILIDTKEVKSGSLLTDMSPPLNPPSEIPDAADTKPLDWVETLMIPDPEARKPDDWDESQPATIIDTSAVKPADWDESASAMLPDPAAVKPEDWDDEEDGEWEPPMVL